MTDSKLSPHGELLTGQDGRGPVADDARDIHNSATKWALRESEWPCGEDTTYLNCSIDAYKAGWDAALAHGAAKEAE